MTKIPVVLIITAVFAGPLFAGVGGTSPPPPPTYETDDKGRFAVCHKGKKTLYVEGEESRKDHEDHGDSMGQCPS